MNTLTDINYVATRALHHFKWDKTEPFFFWFCSPDVLRPECENDHLFQQLRYQTCGNNWKETFNTNGIKRHPGGETVEKNTPKKERHYSGSDEIVQIIFIGVANVICLLEFPGILRELFPPKEREMHNPIYSPPHHLWLPVVAFPGFFTLSKYPQSERQNISVYRSKTISQPCADKCMQSFRAPCNGIIRTYA